jgi:predicted amidophosphoribosyltransferase
MSIKSIFRDLSGLLVQNYCYFCGKIEEIICHECVISNLELAKIQYIQNVPILTMTTKDKIFSKLITSYKDEGVSNLVEPFSKILSVGLKFFSKHQQVKVVNVPSTTKAILKRGNDPISLMTESACLMAGKRFIYEKRLLVNERERKDQASLNFQQRKLNTENAFKANFAEIKPVIIVDDLITTGTSITQSIFALRAKKINIKACVILAANH